MVCLKVRLDLDILPLGKIGGVKSPSLAVLMNSITESVTDKNCSEQSKLKMSITQIKFKVQCSFRTSFPNYSQDIFSKTTNAGHIMHKQVSCSLAKNQNLLL